MKENVIIGRLIPTGERARLDKVKEARNIENSVVAAEEIKLKEAEVKKTKTEKIQEPASAV